MPETQLSRRALLGALVPARSGPEPPSAVWDALDYRPASARLAPVAEAVLATAGVRAGDRVLDVAAGDGNAALAAAAHGAAPTACDFSERMLARGRERTGEQVEWVHARAERLPFEDASFDRVVCSLGAMFSARPQRALAEMFRVVRPGGTVAMANWTASGFVGRALRRAAIHGPPAPGAAAPTGLGREERLRQELSRFAADLRFDFGVLALAFEDPGEAWRFFAAAMGPWAGDRADVEALATELGPPVLDGRYLLAAARRQ